mmetsp:Transcript_45562/g.72899  ORF Transcript_45562/g.72899 Transcript_45562/m.72899 type:complete len:237 (-) Transcript_45562:453-1163(-)
MIVISINAGNDVSRMPTQHHAMQMLSIQRLRRSAGQQVMMMHVVQSRRRRRWLLVQCLCVRMLLQILAARKHKRRWLGQMIVIAVIFHGHRDRSTKRRRNRFRNIMLNIRVTRIWSITRLAALIVRLLLRLIPNRYRLSRQHRQFDQIVVLFSVSRLVHNLDQTLFLFILCRSSHRTRGLRRVPTMPRIFVMDFRLFHLIALCRVNHDKRIGRIFTDRHLGNTRKRGDCAQSVLSR